MKDGEQGHIQCHGFVRNIWTVKGNHGSKAFKSDMYMCILYIYIQRNICYIYKYIYTLQLSWLSSKKCLITSQTQQLGLRSIISTGVTQVPGEKRRRWFSRRSVSVSMCFFLFCFKPNDWTCFWFMPMIDLLFLKSNLAAHARRITRSNMIWWISLLFFPIQKSPCRLHVRTNRETPSWSPAQVRSSARGLRRAAVARGPQQQQGSVVKAPSAAHAAAGGGKCGRMEGFGWRRGILKNWCVLKDVSVIYEYMRICYMTYDYVYIYIIIYIYYIIYIPTHIHIYIYIHVYIYIYIYIHIYIYVHM